MASFFHPKTGNEIAPSTEYIKLLNTTAQEVRKILLDETGAPIMPESVKTLHDLLFQVILNKDIPIEQILNMRHPTSSRDLRPQTFEGMWRIAFALGVVPGYETVTLYDGKIEEGLEGKNVKREDILEYLKRRPIGTSRIDGASDISFSIGHVEEVQSECSSEPRVKKARTQRNFGFCSSKYYRNDGKKSVDQYDVTNIISAALAGKFDSDEFRVLLLTNNKAAVKDTFAMAMRRYITYIVKDDDLHRGILGRDDLEAAFTRLRDQSAVYPDLSMFIQKTFLGVKGPRPFLSLRFHQELVVKKTLEIMKDESRTSVLWGVVARGGKTYIAGGLIRDLRPRVVFIVAGAYTETHTQFIDDLLDVKKRGFQDFADYEVIDVKDETSWGPAYDKNKRYIYFMSLELLKLTDTKAKTRTIMKQVINGEIPIDLVFFDEIHKGGTTDLADKAVNLLGEKAFKVFMTATYIKPFIKPEYKLDPGNLITWGYEDIMTAKAMDSPDTVKYFGNKYGQDICQSVLEYQSQRGISTTDIAAQYQKFPEIQFLSTAFSEEFEENMIQQNVIDPKSGFKMGSLLHVGKECMTIPFNKRYECFSSPATVGLFLNFMGPANKQLEKLPNGSKVVALKSPDEHITDRIGRTSQRRGDRLKNLEKEFKPHSQLWFLPQASGNGTNDKPLLSMMTCLASIIVQHPWFYKNFCVVCVSSGFGSNNKDEVYEDGKGFVRFTNGGNDTKKTVIDAEIAAREQGRGLIILAGRMLTLGVSLPCVNVVALLDDSSSSDLTYQKMFRALTESEGKTIGYVVDVNPIRTLKTLYDYTTIEQDESNSDKAHEPVTITTLTNLYLFDEDRLFVINEDGTRLTADGLQKRLDEYLQKSRKVYKTILAEATANIADVQTLLAEEFGILKDALKRSKPEVLGIVQDLVGLELPSGMERIADAPPDAKVPKPVDKKTAQDEAERLRSLREILLTSMTLLAFLTTETDLPNAFERYKNNDDQVQEIIYKTVVDRGLVTESVDKETIKNVITSSMVKVMTKLMKPYNNMRTQFSEFKGDQRDVVQFIEENLMPKKEQKDARGEVFTPLELVDDMLAHLPEDVWKHPEYKWLDPANGIGNFPVVAFAKLDVGLAEAIPNEAERRKHIVENMLYMCELDSTNVELSKKLLQKMCGDVNCKLNVIQGDSLALTDAILKDTFGVNRFHVIMGNPPYNSKGVGKGGGTAWPKFVKRAFELVEKGGYITFVHPPGWRKFYDPEDRDNQGKIWHTIRNNGWSLLYININDKPRFVSTNVITDYYVIQASNSETLTSYDTSTLGVKSSGKVKLDFSFIPNLITEETISIIRKLFAADGTPLKIVYNQSFKPTAEDKNPVGVPHYHFTTRTGEQMIYYKQYTEPPEYINKPKVFMTMKAGYERGRLFAFYKEPPMGTTNNSMYMLVGSNEEGTKVSTFLNSDIVTFLMKVTQYSEPPNYINEYKILNQLNVPQSMDLSAGELDIIKKIVKPKEEGVVVATPRKKGKARNTTRRSSKTDS
jgi:Type III restriction enzyme, res subunit/N-6 DNA Methylase